MRVTLVIRRIGGVWQGTCPELGTATHADSRAKALIELAEAVALHARTLADGGELDRRLDEIEAESKARRDQLRRIAELAREARGANARGDSHTAMLRAGEMLDASEQLRRR